MLTQEDLYVTSRLRRRLRIEGESAMKIPNDPNDVAVVESMVCIRIDDPPNE